MFGCKSNKGCMCPTCQARMMDNILEPLCYEIESIQFCDQRSFKILFSEEFTLFLRNLQNALWNLYVVEEGEYKERDLSGDQELISHLFWTHASLLGNADQHSHQFWSICYSLNGGFCYFKDLLEGKHEAYLVFIALAVQTKSHMEDLT